MREGQPRNQERCSIIDALEFLRSPTPRLQAGSLTSRRLKCYPHRVKGVLSLLDVYRLSPYDPLYFSK